MGAMISSYILPDTGVGGVILFSRLEGTFAFNKILIESK